MVLTGRLRLLVVAIAAVGLSGSIGQAKDIVLTGFGEVDYDCELAPVNDHTTKSLPTPTCRVQSDPSLFMAGNQGIQDGEVKCHVLKGRVVPYKQWDQYNPEGYVDEHVGDCTLNDRATSGQPRMECRAKRWVGCILPNKTEVPSWFETRKFDSSLWVLYLKERASTRNSGVPPPPAATSHHKLLKIE